jgi:hypothetical protein
MQEKVRLEKEKQQLQKALSQLEQKNKQLTQKLEQDSKSLTEEILGLRNDFDKMKLAKQGIIQESQRLAQENEKLNLDKHKLIQSNEQLMEKQKMAKNEYDSLGAKCKSVADGYKELEDRIKQLQQQIDGKEAIDLLKSQIAKSKETFQKHSMMDMHVGDAIRSTFEPAQASLQKSSQLWKSAVTAEPFKPVPKEASPKPKGTRAQESSALSGRKQRIPKFDPEDRKFLQATILFTQYTQQRDPDRHFRDHFKSAPQEWFMYGQWCRETGQIPIKRPSNIPLFE